MEEAQNRSRRKKASRACHHCQKAHLTCDDDRPCQRCLKRGLQDTCADGARKKAKYLKADEEPAHSEPPALPDTNIQNTVPSQDPAPYENPYQQFYDGTMNFKDDYGLPASGFGSTAANLEYSILSSMLGNGSDASTESPQTQFSPANYNQPPIDPSDPNNASIYHHSQPQRQFERSPASKHAQDVPPQPYDRSWPNGNISFQSHPGNTANASQTQGQGPLRTAFPTSSNSNTGQASTLGPPTEPSRKRSSHRVNDPCEVYSTITKPADYIEVYTGLNQYLRARFDRETLIRIAQSITSYRPSFIACTKTLKEEDLLFAEKAFQRALIEYEKFMSLSGTPTAIWRRTCQLESVGREFCLLTGYSREEVLSKTTFIVEMMDTGSVVEYFEQFAAHAFADTSNVTNTCVLLTKNGRPVPCSVSLTFKRDLFDIPMMIIVSPAIRFSAY